MKMLIFKKSKILKLKVKNVKILNYFILIFFLLIFSFVYSYSEEDNEFHRVKREEIKLSFLFGNSFNVYRFSSGEYYFFTTYLYLIFEPFKDFQLNIYLPFDTNFEKYYKTTTGFDDNNNLITVEKSVFNYYGGLSSFSIGITYTFYTITINDIYFNISFPTGVLSIFYFRNNTLSSISDGYYSVNVGLNSYLISDPVLFIFGYGLNINFKPMIFYEKYNTDIYHKYMFYVNFGFTNVLNYLLSYYLRLSLRMILPEYMNFYNLLDKEIYEILVYLKFGFNFKLNNIIGFHFSMAENLSNGYLNPVFDFYVSVKIN